MLLCPLCKIGRHSVVAIEETVRIIGVLQIRQTLVAPALRSVQGRQGLVTVSVVLVDVQLVVAGNSGGGESVAPFTEEVVHHACHGVIRVRPDGFYLVAKGVAVGKGGIVVGKGLEALDGERLDLQCGCVGQGVVLHELLESVAEIDETLRVQCLGDHAVKIVPWSLGAGRRDETENGFRGEICKRNHTLCETQAERRKQLGILLTLLLWTNIYEINNDNKLDWSAVNCSNNHGDGMTCGQGHFTYFGSCGIRCKKNKDGQCGIQGGSR